MQSIFEATAILFLLFLVLRVSLRRRGTEIRLRGGLVTLNVLTGALGGWAAAMAARAAAARAGIPATASVGAPGGLDITAALLRIMPFAGFVFGGLAGHVVFGALWRRFLRDGPAAARAWLRRAQFVIAGIALILLIRHLLR